MSKGGLVSSPALISAQEQAANLYNYLQRDSALDLDLRAIDAQLDAIRQFSAVAKAEALATLRLLQTGVPNPATSGRDAAPPAATTPRPAGPV